MTDQPLKDQGLPSVKELSVNTCPPLVDPLPDYGSVGSVNRPVRTRMRGGVGRGSSKLPFTRLCPDGREEAMSYPGAWTACATKRTPKAAQTRLIVSKRG
jgi:hypothetical protein